MPEMRKALPVHHTETTDEPWDGPTCEANIPDDAGEVELKKMYAWQDIEADPQAKSSYKFPHHMVDSEGNIGSANIKGCQSSIGILNGARGGADIPDADRQGVYDHMAAHLEDAKVEPPELRSRVADRRLERRCFATELRVADVGGLQHITGHAAVFDQLSDNLGGYREKVDPGAFGDLSQVDVRSLYNHDFNYVLGRTKSGTLKVSTDKTGLYYDAQPPDTQWARDLLVTIGRGDVDQSSFQFSTLRDDWEYGEKEDVRTLLEVELWDVSPVTFPAYPQTDTQLRYAFHKAGLDYEGMERIIVRHNRGLELTASDRDLIGASIDVLKSYLPTGSDKRDRASGGASGFAMLRRRLEIAEAELK